MKQFDLLALGAITVMSMNITSAFADDGFTSHYTVDQKPYRNAAENLSDEDKLKLREYLDYEEREPCQHYQEIPEGFVKNGCDIGLPSIAANTESTQQVIFNEGPQDIERRPVVKDYKIYFDFDKSNIRASERPTLDLVADEIKTYEPYKVTIEGHTDRSGSDNYNMALSQRRAQSVSKTLTKKGIPNSILEKESYGENAPTVLTEDGVRLEENRRVEIQFRK